MFKITTIMLILLAFVFPAAAQDTEDLMDMLVDDLLNLEVVTASKKAQDINVTPADMIVITSRLDNV